MSDACPSKITSCFTPPMLMITFGLAILCLAIVGGSGSGSCRSLGLLERRGEKSQPFKTNRRGNPWKRLNSFRIPLSRNFIPFPRCFAGNHLLIRLGHSALLAPSRDCRELGNPSLKSRWPAGQFQVSFLEMELRFKHASFPSHLSPWSRVCNHIPVAFSIFQPSEKIFYLIWIIIGEEQ